MERRVVIGEFSAQRPSQDFPNNGERMIVTPGVVVRVLPRIQGNPHFMIEPVFNNNGIWETTKAAIDNDTRPAPPDSEGAQFGDAQWLNFAKGHAVFENKSANAFVLSTHPDLTFASQGEAKAFYDANVLGK